MERVSREEQPLGLEMQFGVFWIRVYDLSLKLRSGVIVRSLGGIFGLYEEIDMNEASIMGKFFRIKVKVDLRKPLKRGTVVRHQDMC